MASEMVQYYRNRMADLLRRATEAMRQMDDEIINWRPNEASNSVANLVIHLDGNLLQFTASAIAGGPNRRDRDGEFNDRGWMSRDQAIERLTAAVARTDKALAELAPERFGESVTWYAKQMPLLELALVITTHLGEHVGQILYIGKMRMGDDYRVVSIPHHRA